MPEWRLVAMQISSVGGASRCGGPRRLMHSRPRSPQATESPPAPKGRGGGDLAFGPSGAAIARGVPRVLVFRGAAEPCKQRFPLGTPRRNTYTEAGCSISRLRKKADSANTQSIYCGSFVLLTTKYGRLSSQFCLFPQPVRKPMFMRISGRVEHGNTENI